MQLPQPLLAPGPSRGPLLAPEASSCWLWPHALRPLQGSDSNLLKVRTKAAFLAPTLETLTPCHINSPVDWLLPWQLAAIPVQLCHPELQCLRVHFLPTLPSLPGQPL